MTDIPAWAHETVRLVPPDPTWARRGEELRSELAHRLVHWAAGPVQHVGSTSVPGLAAKPILDLQTAVTDLDCAPQVAAALADRCAGDREAYTDAKGSFIRDALSRMRQ